MKFSEPHKLKITSQEEKKIFEKTHRIVCLADTDKVKIKNLIQKNLIPDGDFFIHCGDFSNSGTEEELKGKNENTKLT